MSSLEDFTSVTQQQQHNNNNIKSHPSAFSFLRWP